MKKFAILLCFVAMSANAASPSSSCPAGYTEIDEPTVIIATECPSGTMSVGTVQSCLVSNPSGDCIMYAPVGMSFTDDSGTYEYTEPCAMQ